MVHYEITSPNGVSHLIVGDGPCATCGRAVAEHFTCPICEVGFGYPCKADPEDFEQTGDYYRRLAHRERRLLHANRLKEAEL